jgi:hypothetical protein
MAAPQILLGSCGYRGEGARRAMGKNAMVSR